MKYITLYYFRFIYDTIVMYTLTNQNKKCHMCYNVYNKGHMFYYIYIIIILNNYK